MKQNLQKISENNTTDIHACKSKIYGQFGKILSRNTYPTVFVVQEILCRDVEHNFSYKIDLGFVTLEMKWIAAEHRTTNNPSDW
jgi:hypothetical protein